MYIIFHLHMMKEFGNSKILKQFTIISKNFPSKVLY